MAGIMEVWTWKNMSRTKMIECVLRTDRTSSLAFTGPVAQLTIFYDLADCKFHMLIDAFKRLLSTCLIPMFCQVATTDTLEVEKTHES